MASRVVDPASARAAIKEYLTKALDRRITDQSFRRQVGQLLSGRGFVFGDDARLTLALGVLVCYQGTSGKPWSDAIPAATSLDLVFSSIELADKALDDESLGIPEWQPSQGINVALALQALAYDVLLDLVDRGFSADQIHGLQRELTGIINETSVAQHLDLVYETAPCPSLEQTLELARLKGGPLTSSVGRLGARLGSQDPEAVEALTTLGWQAGTYAQLVNDLNDCLPGNEHKADIRRRKKTPPIVFFLRPGETAFEQERAWLRGDEPLNTIQEARIRDAMIPSGARDFTEVLAEVHRSQGWDILRSVQNRHDVSQLGTLLLGGSHGDPP